MAQSIARIDQPFPYVPGLFAIREEPPVFSAWRGLEVAPDVILFDGHGIVHPRGLGLAADLGLWLDLPTIGVAKSRLFGGRQPPAAEPGARAELWDEREPARRIGAVLRTGDRVGPVYVSPGHRSDVPTAVAFTLACCAGYRLPEPIRWAHRLAGGDRGRQTSR